MPDTLLGTGLVPIWAHREKWWGFIWPQYTCAHAVEPARRSPLFVCRDSSNRVDIYIYIYMYVRSLCGSGKGRRRGETYISGVPVGFTGNVPPLGHVQGTAGVWPRRRYIHRHIARDGRVVCVVSLLHGIAKENADTDPLGEPQSERVLVSAPDNDHTGYWDASFCSYSCNWNSSPSLRHVAAFR